MNTEGIMCNKQKRRVGGTEKKITVVDLKETSRWTEEEIRFPGSPPSVLGLPGPGSRPNRLVLCARRPVPTQVFTSVIVLAGSLSVGTVKATLRIFSAPASRNRHRPFTSSSTTRQLTSTLMSTVLLCPCLRIDTANLRI